MMAAHQPASFNSATETYFAAIGGGGGSSLLLFTLHGAKRCSYSAEVMKACTISALR